MASISICSNILSIISSPALTLVYEKGVSIWKAKKELVKLQRTIELIQAVLDDAENKQEVDEAVKNWIQRLKGVMYDAEDFFDEVLADDLLKEQMMEGNDKLSLKNQVRVCCSSFNPITSRNSIAKKVKAIRERLVDISSDIARFGFVRSQPNEPKININREKNIGCCTMGENSVIGRDEETNAILDMLIRESSDTAISDGLIVIAIDGIGGMGKTTLAYLIYNHEEVRKTFENNRWFVCISNISNEIEVLEKIYQLMCKSGSCDGLTEIQLVDNIRESIQDKKYLLVLDDVWEDHPGRWKNIKTLLSSGGKGSRIIVTTRLPSVVDATGAVKGFNLKGLSEEDSWNLFKSLAFAGSNENGPRMEYVGRKLLQKCRGVPLAIWSMGSLLQTKTIREWEEIERVGLPMLGGKLNDETIRILKLSYDHLPSNLKQCFTYCCLFPKDHRYDKEDLMYHWIAQGYTKPEEEESDFMHLLRMGFFQEVEEDEFGEIESCKMHDIMHDLALHLAGDESIIMSSTPLNVTVSSCTRHLSLMVDGQEGGLWDIPTLLLNVKSIRSCILSRLSRGHSQPNLDQLCSNFKLLRTLTLSELGIEHIPPSIGKLKMVRYLDLSSNKFEDLPDSITNLVNLVKLNLELCENLKVWPCNFKNLIKLRCLRIYSCVNLSSMPEGIDGMVSLQYLSDFIVQKWSDLVELNKLLKQLRGYLFISFNSGVEVEGEGTWHLPAATKSLQHLTISSYPGHTIRGWGNNESLINLERVQLSHSKYVKYLPSLSCLPILKMLTLYGLEELEFLEEQDVNAYSNVTSDNLFFPCLEEFKLRNLPKLKRWSTVMPYESLEFSNLSKLSIKNCPKLELESFPLCPHLRELDITECGSLKSLRLTSPHLLKIDIDDCDELMSIKLSQRPTLESLTIQNCNQLESLDIELIASVEKMEIKTSRLILENVDTGLIEKLLSTFSMSALQEISISKCNGPITLTSVQLTSLRQCNIDDTNGLECLHIPSPHLRHVSLWNCEGLTSVEVEAPTCINIYCCSNLKNFRIAHPLALQTLEITSKSSIDWFSISNLCECKCLTKLNLEGVDSVFMERLFSSPSLQEGEISTFKSIGGVVNVALTSLESFTVINSHGLKILIIESPRLNDICIRECDELTSFELELPLLAGSFKASSTVMIRSCFQLNNVHITNATALQILKITGCPKLSFSTSVDWDSPNGLERLELNPLPPLEELQLPQCLLQRHALGKLQIKEIFGSCPSCNLNQLVYVLHFLTLYILINTSTFSLAVLKQGALQQSQAVRVEPILYSVISLHYSCILFVLRFPHIGRTP